jgi:hypothetical protein
LSTRAIPAHAEPPTNGRPSEPDDDGGDFTPPSRRPRRRLVTPVTGGLAAVLVAALGFLGGVEVEKHSGSSSGAPTGVPSFAADGGLPGGGAPGGAPGFAGGGGANGQQGAGGTQGTVSYVKKGVIYVKDSDGNTVKVKVSDSTEVTRTAATTAGQVHPGDTVTVQGKASGSTITATSVTAVAEGN